MVFKFNPTYNVAAFEEHITRHFLDLEFFLIKWIPKGVRLVDLVDGFLYYNALDTGNFSYDRHVDESDLEIKHFSMLRMFSILILEHNLRVRLMYNTDKS